MTFVVAGNDLARSVSPAGGSVTFQTGVSQVQISLSVLSDGVPELDATYTVTLTSATGLAIINALGSVVTFIVPYVYSIVRGCGHVTCMVTRLHYERVWSLHLHEGVVTSHAW